MNEVTMKPRYRVGQLVQVPGAANNSSGSIRFDRIKEISADAVWNKNGKPVEVTIEYLLAYFGSWVKEQDITRVVEEA